VEGFATFMEEGIYDVESGEWDLFNLEPVGITPRRLFYEQAGATCQFLYHGENGKYHQPFLDNVCNYYSARVPELDPQKAFGLESEELGRRTVQFARAVAAGWRPR